MSKLIYLAMSSLDGYVADANGNFEFVHPDEEVHSFVNDIARPLRTVLYGRKMYEVLVAWEDPAMAEGAPECIQDYQAIWLNSDKIVFSTTLEEVSSQRTRIETSFEPAAIRQLKEQSPTDLAIGGPHLAAQAITAGLVDEFHLIHAPVIIGSGNPSLPPDVRIDLQLVDQRQFANGFVYAHYRLAQ